MPTWPAGLRTIFDISRHQLQPGIHCCAPYNEFVLIVEITQVNTADLRLKAEDQMRQQYNAMLADCPLPRLWGLSLLGTSLRVYAGDVATGEVEPAFTDPPTTEVLPRDFLEGAWNIDILSQEEFNKMKEIVGDIKVSNAAALEGA